MDNATFAVIGGGIVGASIGYFLSELGETDVVLFERHRLASGVTGVCPGGIRQQFEGEADCRLAQRSVRFYERINETLAPPMPFVFERSGYLFLAHTAAALEKFGRNVALQNRLASLPRSSAPRMSARMLPALDTRDVLGAAFCAEDGFLEDCHGVTNALAALARSRGMRVAYEEVTRLEAVGRSWRLVTSAGTHDVERVIIAAGNETVPLLAGVGRAVPIRPVPRRLLYTGPSTQNTLPPLVVALDRGIALKQLTSGVYYMGWLGESASADNLTYTEETLSRAAVLAPLLADAEARRIIGGLYDMTPDGRPILGAVDGHEGLFVAAGFSGHGFMVAPSAAEAVAHLATGGPAPLAVTEFGLARFAKRGTQEGLYI